jgi:hypothetical protein
MTEEVIEKESEIRKMARALKKTQHDPYAFVMTAFQWGKGELVDAFGPETWQEEFLKGIRDGLNPREVTQKARASGHDIGKSALVAWLILWAISTKAGTRGTVTANTDTQLRTKTWPELAKWHRLFYAKEMFTLTATAIYSSDPQFEKNWRIDLVPWSKTNTEAFAGLHNKNRRVILIFDEASAIDDMIWEVSEGALTDENTERIWVAFGNPTRNAGRFHACFHRLRHRWDAKQIDSRDVKLSDKNQIKKWAEDYGEDSDFFRVRVKGEFPNVGERQFIPLSCVEEARGKHLRTDQYGFAPKILSLDNAWTGGDEVVIGLRQGLAYQQLMVLAKNDNDMLIAGYLAKFEDEHHADAVFIDQGYGTGVVSAGKQMSRRWTLVSFAAESSDSGFLNKRAEMWNLMKQWLKSGGAIPNDARLAEELTGPEYIVKLNGKIVLESKDDMKKRGLNSPNRADALALTFAYPVSAKSPMSTRIIKDGLEFAKTEYDVLA